MKERVVSILMLVLGVLALPRQAFSLEEGRAFFRIDRINGTCSIIRPGATQPEPATSQKVYPFGTLVMVASGDTDVSFAGTCQLKLETGGSLLFKESAVPGKADILFETSSKAGLRVVYDSEDLPSSFRVVMTCGTLSEVSGRLDVQIASGKEGNRLAVTSVGGDGVLTGPQYSIEKFKRGGVAEVGTVSDGSYTIIVNRAGDFDLTLEKGSDEPMKLSTKIGATVKIWRRVVEESGKLAISTLIFNADGTDAGFSYLQGQPAIIEESKSARRAEAEAKLAAQQPAETKAAGKGAGDSESDDATASEFFSFQKETGVSDASEPETYNNTSSTSNNPWDDF